MVTSAVANQGVPTLTARSSTLGTFTSVHESSAVMVSLPRSQPRLPVRSSRSLSSEPTRASRRMRVLQRAEPLEGMRRRSTSGSVVQQLGGAERAALWTHGRWPNFSRARVWIGWLAQVLLITRPTITALSAARCEPQGWPETHFQVLPSSKGAVIRSKAVRHLLFGIQHLSQVLGLCQNDAVGTPTCPTHLGLADLLQLTAWVFH